MIRRRFFYMVPVMPSTTPPQTGNPDALNLYERLGVSPEATDKEIRTAYKLLAGRCHPDKDKTPDATARFQRLEEAYRVLSDPSKRARYDETGEFGMDAMKRDRKALDIIFHFFSQMLLAEEFAIEGKDLIAILRRYVEQEREQLVEKVKGTQRIRAKSEKARRFKRKAKTGENLFDSYILARIKDLDKMVRTYQDEIECHDRATEILAEYNFEQIDAENGWITMTVEGGEPLGKPRWGNIYGNKGKP